ncbi:hypothetical protein F5I97DRAFT_1052657 [Phlebopus sp. FC_14]|nr:hypothetical protein F5I97DRAFT_1052657 [Phlebopus sp. FC_14]
MLIMDVDASLRTPSSAGAGQEPPSTPPINVSGSSRGHESDHAEHAHIPRSQDIPPHASPPLVGSTLSVGSEAHELSRPHGNPFGDFDSIGRLRTGSPGARGGHHRGPSHRPTMGGQHPDHAPGMEALVPIVEKARVSNYVERAIVRSRTGGVKPFVQAPRTVGERLQPTIDAAQTEKNKYAQKGSSSPAKWTGYALNIAIGLQVLLGAMTTGLSVVTTGRQTSIMTSILGGMSTMVASYLARARGSHEPELSITRVKDLEHFLRDCHSFQLDHGHVVGTPEDAFNKRLEQLRHRFEELLGNANGERKLSPV